ncbi:MAG TPA: DUF3048 domain-containing protein [Bacillota bacterium]|jgi:hypothetical protein|nr:DUF3048 domain-containing protein [Bacillota bacterium]HOA35742.1 DUF3048 domain-containing protein [Bacillota bacterium]HOJ85027.1 DUF3048 domain-containing protein [Bacillota bacterium]HOL16958.1 DUF3048 domain-containing protein [Bacillota bacterium]HPZ11834.1 DUF3048 domain-containing protein [Bacillota bacterium]
MRRFRAASILGLVVLLLFIILNGYFAGRVNSQVTEITELEDIIKALDESIKVSQLKIDRLAGQIESTKKQIGQAETEIADAEARLEESTRLFATRVRGAYINGGGISYLEIILGADNFGDLLVRVAYLERILNRDANLIASIKHERGLIEERKKIIDEQYSNLLALMEQEKAEHNTMLAQRREKEKLLKEAVEKTAGYKPVYGVVIDNHSNARPQSGLALANVVYEFEVEGRITRYLALFSVFAPKVGPIRSARTHSIQLALENNVHYIYAGGTSDIIAAISALGLRHTNADNPSLPGHIRTTDRRPPHNLYIDLAKLGKEPPSRVVEVRPAFLDREGKPCSTVSLEYNSFTKIKYQYRPASRDYLRYLNGEVHRDASGKEIVARNIIIQYVPHYTDFRKRPTPDLIGSGPIDFYSMGQHFRGTWRKDSPASRTRFCYEDGKEIEMVYGRTWIQIVRPR